MCVSEHTGKFVLFTFTTAFSLLLLNPPRFALTHLLAHHNGIVTGLRPFFETNVIAVLLNYVPSRARRREKSPLSFV